jgi:hypothetical protein
VSNSPLAAIQLLLNNQLQVTGKGFLGHYLEVIKLKLAICTNALLRMWIRQNSPEMAELVMFIVN